MKIKNKINNGYSSEIFSEGRKISEITGPPKLNKLLKIKITTLVIALPVSNLKRG
jgi:hypothetical protein